MRWHWSRVAAIRTNAIANATPIARGFLAMTPLRASEAHPWPIGASLLDRRDL